MNLSSADSENRAKCYLPNCKQLRMDKGKSMNELAKAADIDRASLKKIESKHPVTELVASKVFNALNLWHNESLIRQKTITTIKPS